MPSVPHDHSRLRIAPTVLALLAFGGLATAQEPTAPGGSPSGGPFRLNDALDLPEWLRVSGSSRVRFEGLEGEFRSDPRFASSDYLLFLRQTLLLEVDVDAVTFGVEGIDARQFGAGARSALGAGTTDAVDFLQGYVEVSGDGPFGTSNRFQVGRQTHDFGSRRLAGRNRFRNSIDSFTGAYLESETEDLRLQAFWFLPTQIKPTGVRQLVDNEPELDAEDIDLQFYGTYLTADVAERTTLEGYFYVVTDRRSGSPERELYTPGVRARRASAAGAFDFEFEGNLQFGRSQATPGGPDLDHFAWYLHSEVGYTFDDEWTPRLVLQFDGGSGDESPTDGQNNRFDPLFQIRADLGPLGIFGPIGRTNTLSPALNLELHPDENARILLGWRSVFLTVNEDVAAIGGVQDPTGAAGSEYGHQLQLVGQWDVVPDSLKLELGIAHLFPGTVLRQAPNGRGEESTFVYFETLFTF